MRLAITLHCLFERASFTAIRYHWRFGKSTVSKIVHKTCAAIWSLLMPRYLSPPSISQHWQLISSRQVNFSNLYVVLCVETIFPITASRSSRIFLTVWEQKIANMWVCRLRRILGQNTTITRIFTLSISWLSATGTSDSHLMLIGGHCRKFCWHWTVWMLERLWCFWELWSS